MIEHLRTGNISERCAREAATAEARTLGLVARSVTHQLRQPLSLIAGYAELLAHRPLAEGERAAFVEEIREAASRLAASLQILERPYDLAMLAFGPEWERQVLDLRPEVLAARS